MHLNCQSLTQRTSLLRGSRDDGDDDHLLIHGHRIQLSQKKKKNGRILDSFHDKRSSLDDFFFSTIESAFLALNAGAN